MKVFVTGATGFIGSHLALKLARSGYEVHALYRDEAKAAVLRHPGIRLFKGDILDYESVAKAVSGCTNVFHTAAFANVWHRDKMQIYRLNLEGTMNVVRAGIYSGVQRFVCTSTAGALGVSDQSGCCDEQTPRPGNFFIDYECSKAIMESSLKAFSAAGVLTITVSPTRVYGPGVLSDSNGITRIMKKYIAGNWRVIPGDGSSIGNYVFVDDVVDGHIRALEKGRPGEHYILGGSNLTYDEFFRQLAEVAGMKYTMFHIPVPIAEMAAYGMMLITAVTGKPPLITPALVRKYNHHWCVSGEKAAAELNYHPVDFKTGAAVTVDWLKSGCKTWQP